MPGKLHYTAIREWPRVNIRSEAYNPSAVKEHKLLTSKLSMLFMMDWKNDLIKFYIFFYNID